MPNCEGSDLHQAFRSIEERLRLYAKLRRYAAWRAASYGRACGPRGGPVEELEPDALIGYAVRCWLEGKPVYDPQVTTLYKYLEKQVANRVSALCRPPLAPGPRLSIVSPDEPDRRGTIPSDRLPSEPPPDPFLQRDIERLLSVRQQHLVPLFRLVCKGIIDSADQARELGIKEQSLIANRRAALKRVVRSYVDGEHWRKSSRDDKQNKSQDEGETI